MCIRDSLNSLSARSQFAVAASSAVGELFILGVKYFLGFSGSLYFCVAVFPSEVEDNSLNLYWLPSDGAVITGAAISGVSSTFEGRPAQLSCSLLRWQNS